MSSINPTGRCRLCERTMEEPQLREHLRIVHEVMPHEETVADVPVAR